MQSNDFEEYLPHLLIWEVLTLTNQKQKKIYFKTEWLGGHWMKSGEFQKELVRELVTLHGEQSCFGHGIRKT